MGQRATEAALLRAERRLVEALELRTRPMPGRLMQARGLWKDAPVTITTRAYEGDAVTYLRVASISGIQLAMGSLLACGRPNRALPILSAQLVTRGFDRETTVQVELAPVGDAGPVSTPSQRAVPEPAVDPLAAFARQVDAWTVLSQGSTPAPDLAAEVDRRQREYLATNRADAATRSLLGAMFGHAWAEEYVVTVLYPEGAPK